MELTHQDTSPAIDIRQLSFGYRSKEGTVHALEDLTLSIPKGEFFGLVGPSGSGKTTLLRLIADLIQREKTSHIAGSITVLSNPPSKARLDRNFGFLFQDSALLPWRNVIQNVMLPAQIMGIDDNEHHQRAHRLLDTVGLVNFKENRVSELSGGMQQRVSLVRALITNPKILLLDEPFASLDHLVREHLTELLQELWNETKPTVIFVTHDLADAVTLCDSIAVLTKRPARLIATVQVNLPRPRTFKHQLEPEYINSLKRVRSALKGQYEK